MKAFLQEELWIANLVVDEVLDSSHLPLLGAAVDVVGSGNDLNRETNRTFNISKHT